MDKPNRYLLTHFCLQNVCSVSCVCFQCLSPWPCILSGWGQRWPLCSDNAGTGTQPPPPQEHARGLVQLLPQLFFSRDPESEAWVRMGWEQHVLSLSVFNRRMVCPSQLMGTRTCRVVHPPHSAAAMVSEPAGALRSRAAPCQPSSQGQL